MKSIVSMTLSALGVAGLGVVAVLGSQNVDKGAGNRNTLMIDLAVDCRTAVSGPNRGDIFIINGKLFPAGTLASGAASNDPILPVNGVAPIGDWLVRGHHALPLPKPPDHRGQCRVQNGRTPDHRLPRNLATKSGTDRAG